jgi:nucleoside-diphosphate-sugar epimerase
MPIHVSWPDHCCWKRDLYRPPDPLLSKILPAAPSGLTTATFSSHPVNNLVSQVMARRRILLTGADTLIGGRTLNQLLAYDVSVRAVVRSQDQGQVHLLRQQYPATRYPWLEVAIVPQSRLSIPGAFDDALRDHPEPFDTIIHVAIDQPDGADCLARFVNLQTECLINLLRSIKRTSAKVHRVVIMTSLSPFARWLVQPGPGSYNPYNPASHRSAEVDPEYILATSQASDNIVHAAIKNWMHGARARFELVYVTAPSVYGPSMQHLGNSADLQEANRRIWNICSSDTHERVRSPPYGIDYYIDVRVSLLSLLKGITWTLSAYTVLGFCDCRCPGSLCSTGWQQTFHDNCWCYANW